PVYSLDLSSFPTRRSSDLPCTIGFVGQVNRCSLYAFGVSLSDSFDGCAVWLYAVCTFPFRSPCGLPASRDNSCCAELWWPSNERDRKSTRLNSSHVKISYA